MNTFIGTMSPFEHGEVFVLKDGGEGENVQRSDTLDQAHCLGIH